MEISRSVAVNFSLPSSLLNKIVSRIGKVAFDGTAPITAERPLLSSLLETENFIKFVSDLVVSGNFSPILPFLKVVLILRNPRSRCNTIRAKKTA